jgi:hypothetical protein
MYEARESLEEVDDTAPGEYCACVANLERKPLIVSSLDPDGQVRWRVTEKGRHVTPDEVCIRHKLPN